MSEDPPNTDLGIACLGLPDEISLSLALSPDPPATVGALLALARGRRLTEIKGIGPARRRTIEASLIRAGHDLGDRLGRRSFLPGRPQ